MREPDGSVVLGSGCINARRASLGHAAPPPRPGAPSRPGDTRPLHVRMREAKDARLSWNVLADRFHFATANAARTYVLRKEREAGHG